MADILQDIRALNENDAADTTEIKGLVKMLDEKYNPEWEEARFLGRGTVTTSEIFFTSPSRCAVADSCSVSLDRRMTAGETWESCLDEIRALPAVQKYGDDVTVSMYEYNRPSYTDLVYPIECYFPTWVIPKDHKVTQALEEAYKGLYGEERLGNAETEGMRKARPLTDKWTFSTNGVTIMGRNSIPCIGFDLVQKHRLMLRTKNMEDRPCKMRCCIRCSSNCILQIINKFSNFLGDGFPIILKA